MQSLFSPLSCSPPPKKRSRVAPAQRGSDFVVENPDHRTHALWAVLLEVPRTQIVSLQVSVARHKDVIQRQRHIIGSRTRETTQKNLSEAGVDFEILGWRGFLGQGKEDGKNSMRNPRRFPEENLHRLS